ncbi:MAG TPA: molybdopterin-dependent oxidoreductase, partial [Armatimonadota bacterium]|nr:molybdopterin-dependent oxidoreductase [Armatimonadota bacterium]
PNRCVLCQRCVRVCSEKVGANTLDFRQRGIQQMISPDAGMPLGKSSCLSCGACMQVCPTGAITPKDSAYLERATAVNNRRDELKTISSTCAGCSVGCRTLVRVFEDRLLSIDADMEAGDAGTLCEGGRFLKLKDNRPRITRPMVRRDGKLQETDWKTALAYVAERMQKSVREFGAGSVAGIASPSQPNETLYLFQKMMRAGVGTGNVDAIGGNAVRMARAATESLVGENVRAKVEAGISDLDKADLFLIIGADPVKTNPVIGAAVIRGFFNRQAKLVVINQDETRLGEIADLNLRPRDGSEGFLINGMMRTQRWHSTQRFGSIEMCLCDTSKGKLG